VRSANGWAEGWMPERTWEPSRLPELGVRALPVVAALAFLLELPGGGYSWHYFSHGAAVLFGGSSVTPAGGLHLYANYPDLQIGPVSFLVAQVLRQLGPSQGLFAAQLVMMALGLLVLRTLRDAMRRLRPDLGAERRAVRLTVALGGALFLIVWASLAVYYAHLDDVLALTFAALAVKALAEHNPALAGLCLALSTDAKPWAAVFLPLALAAPRVERRYAVCYALAGILPAWLPFVLADPGTLKAAGYAIVNQPSSALRALGVATAGTPSWDRPAQLLIGCALGALAIRQGRWPAVLLLGVAARLVLDPGVYDYYTAGLLLGTLCWELLGLRRPVPLWTPIGFAALYLAPRVVGSAALLGHLRLWGLLLLCAGALLLPRGWCARVTLPARRTGRVLPLQSSRTPAVREEAPRLVRGSSRG
jgi:hypothetical protein